MIRSVNNVRAMTDEEFLLLRDLIHDYCGIDLPESMKYLLERRLRPRVPVVGVDTYRNYYRHVRYGRDPQAELDEIVERITTNETYFFRGEAQLRAFSEEIIPEVVRGRRAGATIRIWSAGCSSGEEPYTLAMLLNEAPAARGFRFEISAHDISRKVLRIAREGIYREASFRQTDAAERGRYFKQIGARYRLNDDIRQRVTFGHLNLMNEGAMALLSDIDVVFCRNVMIYFGRDARKRLLDSFLRRMRPGGFLVLGHSESLINVSTGFELAPLVNDIVYRKPLF